MSTDTHGAMTQPTSEAVVSPLDAAVHETTERMMDRPELLQMRMENETIMAECRVRPRNIAAMKAEIRVLLDEFPDLASQAIYNKPVGKEGSRMKYASGLSIRAAEVLAEVYGFNRVRSDATPLDEAGTKYKVDATFTDFQKGRIWQDGGIVSVFYKSRDNTVKRHTEDRFFNVVLKAEAAKRVREVILRSVNSSLKAWFQNECRKVMAKQLGADKVAEIIEAFSGKGVGLERLEGLLGRAKAMGWTVQDHQLLQGVWNAIKDGETTIEEAFGALAGQKEEAATSDLADRMMRQPKSPGNGHTEPTAEQPDPASEETPQDEPDEDTLLRDEFDSAIQDAKTITGDDQYSCATVEKTVNVSFDAGDLTPRQHADILAQIEAKRVKIRSKRGAGRNKAKA